MACFRNGGDGVEARMGPGDGWAERLSEGRSSKNPGQKTKLALAFVFSAWSGRNAYGSSGTRLSLGTRCISCTSTTRSSRPLCSFTLCSSSLACSLSLCSSSLWSRSHVPRSDRSRSSTAQSSPTSTRGRSRRPSSEASTKSTAACCPTTTARSVRRATSSSQTSTPTRESHLLVFLPI